MAKRKKARAAGKKKIKDIGVKDAAKTVGGVRKAGGTQQEYYTIKLSDSLISS